MENTTKVVELFELFPVIKNQMPSYTVEDK